MCKRALSEPDVCLIASQQTGDMILCEEAPCEHQWIAIELYPTHVEQLHQHICSHCKVNLTKEYWLELHFEEVHDPFLRDKIFCCLERDCSLTFNSTEERTEHLKNCHYYPSFFKFSIIETGI